MLDYVLCIIYYILCIDLLYILTLFYLIVYDYVYTVTIMCIMCMFICTLSRL